MQRLAVVTGATSGIGLETARLLARSGWQVLCVGRDAARGEAALRQLQHESGGNGAHQLFTTDLSSLQRTRWVASEIAQRAPRIDLLLNNAGSLFHTRQVTSEGYERTFALNHLGYFVLTEALLPQLKAAAHARVVNVASAAHYGAQLDLDDLQMRARYSGWQQYKRSKLMNVLFTRELARRLHGSRVTANCLHPGFVASRFGSGNSFWWRAIFRTLQLTAISPRKSGEAVYHVATWPELANTSGRYFNLSQQAEP